MWPRGIRRQARALMWKPPSPGVGVCKTLFAPNGHLQIIREDLLLLYKYIDEVSMLFVSYVFLLLEFRHIVVLGRV